MLPTKAQIVFKKDQGLEPQEKVNTCAQWVRDYYHQAEYYTFYIPVDKITFRSDKYKALSDGSDLNSARAALNDWLALLASFKMPFTLISFDEKEAVVRMNGSDYSNKWIAQAAWDILRYIYVDEVIYYKNIIPTFYMLVEDYNIKDKWKALQLACILGPLNSSKSFNDSGIAGFYRYDSYYGHIPNTLFKLLTLEEWYSKCSPNNVYLTGVFQCKCVDTKTFPTLSSDNYMVRRLYSDDCYRLEDITTYIGVAAGIISSLPFILTYLDKLKTQKKFQELYELFDSNQGLSKEDQIKFKTNE